jgi:hypothetical protein
MIHIQSNALTSQIRRLAATIVVVAGAVQVASWVPSALAAPLHPDPARLRPEPPGYWKHPPLPSHHADVSLRPEPPGYWKHPPAPGPAHIHAATTAAMSGWQIALFAAAAALLTLTVLAVFRSRGTRRPTAAAA